MKSYKNRSYKKKHSFRGGEEQQSLTSSLSSAVKSVTPENLMPKEESVFEKIKNKASELTDKAKSLFGGRKKHTKKRVRFSKKIKRVGGSKIKKPACKAHGKLRTPTKRRTCKKKTGPKRK